MSPATLDRPTAPPTEPHAAACSRLPALQAPPAVPPDYRTLFAVPFRSAMTAADAHRLAAAAGLACDLRPELRGDTVSPGLRRLDFASGLFLVRGDTDGTWRLEGRTWGHPAPGAVRRWHLWAAAAARALDPGVALPGRRARS